MEKIYKYVKEFEEQLKLVDEQLKKYSAREIPVNELLEEMEKVEELRRKVIEAMGDILIGKYRTLRQEREQRNMHELGYWS